MEYSKSYDAYMNYVEECRKVIKSTFFTREDTKNIDNIDLSLNVSDIVRTHRLKMIDIKLEHTMRMIEQVIKINANLGLQFNLDMIMKVAVLYHDIGRMRQATWTNSFGDVAYIETNSRFKNHGEDGYDIFMNNNFNVDKRYAPVIGQSIRYHQNYLMEERLKYKYLEDLSKLKVDEVLTGSLQLNENEWQVASLIVQLVADIDKTDILYQHLSDDFGMIREYILDGSKESLDNIAKYWGISKQEIIEYNNIEESLYEPRRIKVPIKNMPVYKLEIPQFMKEMFYNNSWPELKDLIRERHWNFISILWWRLSHFLNEISFTSVLVNIEESKLLDRIYDKIPDNLKPTVVEAFNYAKEVLVYDKIKKNVGNIYLKKKMN